MKTIFPWAANVACRQIREVPDRTPHEGAHGN